MKLNEIYQWFVDNVPYFRQRSGTEEAAGWKVSYQFIGFIHFKIT